MPGALDIPQVCIEPRTYIDQFTDIMRNYAALYSNLISSNSTGTSTALHVNEYYLQLQKQKIDLNNKIQELTSSTGRHSRDFIDLEKVLEPNTSSIHVLDDITLWMLLLSYILFAVSIVFWYSHIHMYSISSIAISLGGMLLISLLLVVLAIIIL
jgi:hypothetical protein